MCTTISAYGKTNSNDKFSSTKRFVFTVHWAVKLFRLCKFAFCHTRIDCTFRVHNCCRLLTRFKSIVLTTRYIICQRILRKIFAFPEPFGNIKNKNKLCSERKPLNNYLVLKDRGHHWYAPLYVIINKRSFLYINICGSKRKDGFWEFKLLTPPLPSPKYRKRF